jgi:hypothetical protein
VFPKRRIYQSVRHTSQHERHKALCASGSVWVKGDRYLKKQVVFFTFKSSKPRPRTAGFWVTELYTSWVQHARTHTHSLRRTAFCFAFRCFQLLSCCRLSHCLFTLNVEIAPGVWRCLAEYQTVFTRPKTFTHSFVIRRTFRCFFRLKTFSVIDSVSCWTSWLFFLLALVLSFWPA